MKPLLIPLRLFKNKLAERHVEETLLFISVGVLSAIVCSIYAKFFSAAEALSLQLFSQRPGLLFILGPAGLLGAYAIVRFLAPGSRGSGIPQVMACIENDSPQLADEFLKKSVIIVKFLSSLIAIFFGGAIGREGPSLQISAAIAHNLGKVLTKNNFSIRKEQVLIAGAASGLAAAFNTPIGGIVYAIEELSKEHVRKFKDVLLLAVVISGITAQLIMGNYLYLGVPQIPDLHGFQYLFWIGALSILAGVLGGVFSRVLLWLIRWREGKSLLAQLAIVIGVGLALAGLHFIFGENALYSGKQLINQTLFTKQNIEWSSPILRIISPILSSMTGIAGGIFAPSLSAGAAIGGFLADLFTPELRTVFALSGMVAFLTGVTHTPITSFILVLEMTDRHTVVLPMMVAAIFSMIGTRLVTEMSFYEKSLESIRLKTQKEGKGEAERQ